MNRILKRLTMLIISLALLTGCEDDDPTTEPVDPFIASTQYGNVNVTLSGLTPHNHPFTQMMNFKYMPEYQYTASMVTGFGSGHRFKVIRRPSVVEPIVGNGFYIDVDLAVELDMFAVREITLAMSVKDDNEFFEVYGDFKPAENQITNYSYNQTTGKLKATLTATLTAAQNPTGYPHDLFLTAEVNVIVFKDLEPN